MNIVTNQLKENAKSLQLELAWFEELLEKRTERFREASNGDLQKNHIDASFLLSAPPPDFQGNSSIYANLVQDLYEDTNKYYANQEIDLIHLAERLILILTLTPHIKPQILDLFFYLNSQNREFTEFGGYKGSQHKGFLPTGETAMFILAGDNLELRLVFQSIFDKHHFFAKNDILRLVVPNTNEPFLSGVLELSKEYLQLLTTGKTYQPDYSPDFPAKKIETQLNWDDLVLDYHTWQDVDEVKAWIKHRHTLRENQDFSRELIGYRCLFYGESGTGKTLTTTLLGKELDLPVYRIDLSKIVSKYIGETEKNLSNIFYQAENKDWILFFDEGDALFGKRTQNKSSHDRYANQEISYLLQKIEEHPGIIILATNIRSNMDKAFLRRFQSEVYFPVPNEQTRLELWKKAFPQGYTLDQRINLEDIARKYTITGAAIKNIKHYCMIMTLDRNEQHILYEDFKEGLRKQLDKEGKKL